MKPENNKKLLDDIKAAQPNWFSIKNKKFFGDVSYQGRYSKKGERFLQRSTYAWTDLCGGEPTLHYRLNRIGDDYEILELVDEVFESRAAVNKWLRDN